ncbi:MAG: hypothetical protein ALAOOOJD_00481 [bacterium]|nr:hypothetical protein [bacterium]
MKEKTPPQQPPFNYVTMMVPVPLPPMTDNRAEEKSKSDMTVFGAFFWAVVILLAVWFITGGYNLFQ